MSDYEFFHSNLKAVEERVKILEEKEKEKQDILRLIPWSIGTYVQAAIASSFSKKSKYPENPLKIEEVVVEDMELTEEEKIEYSQRWVDKLTGMMEKNKAWKESQGE